MSYYVERIRWYQRGNETKEEFKTHIRRQIANGFSEDRRPSQEYLIHHIILLLIFPFIPRVAAHYLVLDKKYLKCTTIEAKAAAQRRELDTTLDLYNSLDPVIDWEQRHILRSEIPNRIIQIANILSKSSLEKYLIDEALHFVSPCYGEVLSHVRVTAKNILRLCSFQDDFKLHFACVEVIGERLFEKFLHVKRELSLGKSDYDDVIQHFLHLLTSHLTDNALCLVEHKLRAKIHCDLISTSVFILRSPNCEFYRMLQHVCAGKVVLPWLV